MVPVRYAEHGTTFQVQTPGSATVGATVVPMPHWDPNKDIPKS
jgi:glycine cleavage system aminomethyltransferase T